MPRWLHILVQVLTPLAGIFASLHGISWAPIASSAVQAVVGVVQQSYNTDGTPQTVAFTPNQK